MLVSLCADPATGRGKGKGRGRGYAIPRAGRGARGAPAQAPPPSAAAAPAPAGGPAPAAVAGAQAPPVAAAAAPPVAGADAVPPAADGAAEEFSPVRTPRTGPAGEATLAHFKKLVEEEELEPGVDHWTERFNAIGLADLKRLANRKDCAFRNSPTGVVWREAAINLFEKLKAKAGGPPVEPFAEFNAALVVLMRRHLRDEGDLDKQLSKLRSSDAADAAVEPDRYTEGREARDERTKEQKDRDTVDKLLQCVTAQCRGQPPLATEQPRFGDVLVVHEGLMREPSEVVPMEAAALLESVSRGSGTSTRHSKGKVHRHSRGESRASEARLLDRFLRTLAVAGAMETTRHELNACDYRSGLEHDDGEPITLLANWLLVLEVSQAARGQMEDGRLSGRGAEAYVKAFVRELRAKMNEDNTTVTYAARDVLRSHHEKHAGRSAKGGDSEASETESSTDSDSDSGSASPRRERRRKRASSGQTAPRKKAKKSSSGGGSSKDTNNSKHLCLNWAKHECFKLGRGCSDRKLKGGGKCHRAHKFKSSSEKSEWKRKNKCVHHSNPDPHAGRGTVGGADGRPPRTPSPTVCGPTVRVGGEMPKGPGMLSELLWRPCAGLNAGARAGLCRRELERAAHEAVAHADPEAPVPAHGDPGVLLGAELLRLPGVHGVRCDDGRDGVGAVRLVDVLDDDDGRTAGGDERGDIPCLDRPRCHCLPIPPMAAFGEVMAVGGKHVEVAWRGGGGVCCVCEEARARHRPRGPDDVQRLRAQLRRMHVFPHAARAVHVHRLGECVDA